MNRSSVPRRVVRRKPSKTPFLVMFGGLVLLFAAAWLGLRQRDGSKTAGETVASAPVEAVAEAMASAPTGPARLIDGVFAATEEPVAEAPYLAVIVDNHAEARPASGLNRASVVYEAPAEAGITRFLAVFASGAAVEQLGPVRSVRPYYIDWASEYDALLVHCGGSPAALSRLKGGADSVTDLNEFWNGGYFWRSSARSAPHNVYTSSELMEKAALRKEATAKELASWRFKDDAPVTERPSEASLYVGSKASGYAVTWNYVPEQNAYMRTQGGRVQRDGEEAILARNIAVVFSEISVIDDVGRRRIQTSGEGQAVLALDGQTYRGTWRKASPAARMRFYDASGTELRLNRGTTWIEVVPENTEVR